MPLLHQIIGDVITTVRGDQYDGVLRLDVKDFYPSIDHELLLKQIQTKIRKKEILHLVKDAISSKQFPSQIPTQRHFQLSVYHKGCQFQIFWQIYICRGMDFKHKGKGSYRYFRYVDDILIVCRVS